MAMTVNLKRHAEHCRAEKQKSVRELATLLAKLLRP
jgi:hypothetical protein